MNRIVGRMALLPAAGGSPPAGPSRLYFSNDAADYTPTTKRGDWDDSSANLAKKLGVKAGVSATSVESEASATNNFDVLHGRWISDPLAYNVTISGTATWVIGADENNALANQHLHIHVFVTQGDSDVVRGTLITNSIDPTEYGTAGAGMGEASQAITSVDAQIGDRIVVEVGTQHQNTLTGTSTGTIYYGNTGATDLTAGDANVTTRPGWIEFSAGLGLP